LNDKAAEINRMNEYNLNERQQIKQRQKLPIEHQLQQQQQQQQFPLHMNTNNKNEEYRQQHNKRTGSYFKVNYFTHFIEFNFLI